MEWALENVNDPAIQAGKNPAKLIDGLFDQRGTSPYAELKREMFDKARDNFLEGQRAEQGKAFAAEKLAADKQHKEQLAAKDKEIERLQKQSDSWERQSADWQEKYHSVNGEVIRYRAMEDAQRELAPAA